MIAKRITHVAEIGLRVTNLAEMIDFYQHILGFDVENVYEHHAFLRIAPLDSPLGQNGHALILGLFDRERALDVRASTLDHLAFEIPNEYYDEELARFKAKEMVIRERSWPESLDWRARSFFFTDPEGNVIEIIASKGINN